MPTPKKSSSKRARPSARAANKPHQQRAKSARKPSRAKQSTSGLAERTVAELRSQAAELDIAGRSKMKKSQLIRAIRRRQ